MKAGTRGRAGLAIATSTVAALLAAGELTARLEEPSARSDDLADWQVRDGDVPTARPTAAGWPPWEDYNIEGLRDREHAIEKRPTAWRIACLGDGVTMGRGIRPQQAWPQVLEDLAAAAGRDLDVMNVALVGWSTRQELAAYRKIVRRYRPDQVLLGISLNDVARLEDDPSRPPSLVTALCRRSVLARRVFNPRKHKSRRVEELFTSPGAGRVRDAYERMFADLRTLRDEVSVDGGRLSVLVLPFRFQLVPGAPRAVAQQTIAGFCTRESIPFLDPLPALMRLGGSVFIDPDHLGPAGARLVAQEVLDTALPEEAGAPWSGDVPPLAPRKPTGRDPLPLLEALGDPSDTVRAAAARALANLGEASAPAVPALVGCLDDASHAVRGASARALGAVGQAAAAAVPRLVRLLDDHDSSLRAGAAHALGGIGTAATPAVPALVGHLADADEDVRWSAADALGKIAPGATAVPLLQALVRDANSPGRGLAAEALGRIGPAAHPAVPALVDAVSDLRAEVRRQAVWALGRIGPDATGAVPVLRGALADADLRWRAAEALGRIGPGAVAAVPDLVAVLRDSSSRVRRCAARALGAIGACQAGPALARVVGDPAGDVRLAAVTGLIEVAAPAPVATPAFLQALGDVDSRVRLRAVRGLARAGTFSPGARLGLEHASRDPDQAVRAQAARALHNGRH